MSQNVVSFTDKLRLVYNLLQEIRELSGYVDTHDSMLDSLLKRIHNDARDAIALQESALVTWANHKTHKKG